MWIEILKKEVANKGPKIVAKELGVSRATVDLVCQGKYMADTKRIELRVMSIYGRDGKVECPLLGLIEPIRCSENWQRAKKIGMKAGNPETLKLYKACMKCGVRR